VARPYMEIYNLLDQIMYLMDTEKPILVPKDTDFYQKHSSSSNENLQMILYIISNHFSIAK
jgi:hypothetical protein